MPEPVASEKLEDEQRKTALLPTKMARQEVLIARCADNINGAIF